MGTIRLTDITLTDAQADALTAWLDILAAEQAHRAAEAQAEQDEQAMLGRRAEQIMDIARQYAERHGPLEWMADHHQANAAYESWFDAAGYVDLESGAEVGWEEQELWEQTYVGRLEEMRRERRG